MNRFARVRTIASWSAGFGAVVSVGLYSALRLMSHAIEEERAVLHDEVRPQTMVVAGGCDTPASTCAPEVAEPSARGGSDEVAPAA